jgi:hypothetical protein
MNPKDRRPCEFPGCAAHAVLRELIPDPNSLPRMVNPGDEYPQPARLRAWVCEMNPKRHIQVIGWGFRPTKDCIVAGCDGVMIHTDRARYSAPEDLRRPLRGQWAKLEQHAGFLCMKNETQVELDVLDAV